MSTRVSRQQKKHEKLVEQAHKYIQESATDRAQLARSSNADLAQFSDFPTTDRQQLTNDYRYTGRSSNGRPEQHEIAQHHNLQYIESYGDIITDKKPQTLRIHQPSSGTRLESKDFAPHENVQTYLFNQRHRTPENAEFISKARLKPHLSSSK